MTLKHFSGWLILLMILSGCGSTQQATEGAAQPAMAATEEGEIMTYQLRDLTLPYKVVGEGQPVLMLHGWPTDHRSMVGAFEPVFSQREGWKRIYLDLPGMGEATGGSWLTGNDDVVDVLAQFMDDVFPDEHILVVGFSYGGYLARGLLHRKQEQIDGMMLLVPSVPDSREERVLPPQRVIVSNPEGLAQFPAPLDQFLGSILVVQDDAVLARQMEVVAGIELADEEILGRISENYGFTFAVDDLPNPYEQPVLILTGKHDTVTGYEDAIQLLQYYPRATYAVLDRAGHGLHMEQPDLFNHFVNEWLDRIVEAQQTN